MKPAGWLVLVALALGGAPVSAQISLKQSQSEAQAAILFRAAPLTDNEQYGALLDDLMRLAEPTAVVLDRGADVRDVLRRQCGEARPKEIEALKELNPALSDLVVDDAVMIRVPPCPYWTGPVSVVVPRGSSVVDMMHVTMGASGPRSLARVQELNPGVDLSKVEAGQSITFPFATRSVSYRLKEQVEEAQKLVATIVSKFENADAQLFLGEVRVVRPVALTAEQTGDCSGIAKQPHWPFDAVRLAQILRHNDAVRLDQSRHAIAAVADTGIDRNETRLPLARSTTESDDATLDLDKNGYFGDAIGVNLATSVGFPAADPRDVDMKHGTHVAALVAGQTMTSDLATLAAARIRLKILNLKALVQVTPDPAGGEPHAVFNIPPDGLGHAHFYANQFQTSVLNLSVESAAPIEDFRSNLAERALLTVVAAGNSSLDLDAPGNRRYPAIYRRDRPEKLITVAAHGPDGKLAWFSNRGVKTVDLAAPGVCIDSFVPGGRERLNGTSQAAPLVSFTAALLAAEGMSPAAIKRRIVATVDIEKNLPVVSEGRLNVLKAAACYDDQLEIEGRGWLRGRLAPGTTVRIGDQVFPAAHVARILPRYGSGGQPMKVFFKEADRDPVTSALPAQDIAFETLGASQDERFRWDQVLDFIPRDCQGR